jgi:NAD(P)-dependent dehydrogenase (short-subunit alcohol dehydrogenase family)
MPANQHEPLRCLCPTRDRAQGRLSDLASARRGFARQGGIRSKAVGLGVIRTPMHDPASHDTLAKPHPVGRLGEVDDVVDAVLYLENAGFVTGEILHVDGGQSAGH